MVVNRKVTLAVVAACSVAMAGVATAGASVISANFTGGNGGPYSLASTDTAGAVAEQNWNNLSSNNGGPQTLNDSTGTATTASASWSSADVWGAFGASQSSPDLQMLNGYIDTHHQTLTSASVTVSNVPYTSYEVIAYFNSDHANTGSSPSFGNVNIGSTTYYFTAIGPVSADYSPSPYTQTTTTTDPGAASSSDLADYAVFTGLSGSSFTLTASAEGLSNSGNNLGITGFQIVDTTAVPEPATMGMFAAGAMGLLLVSRRKAKAV